MIDFTLMNKALKGIWIKRFKLNENSAWTAIADEATSHLGGLPSSLTATVTAKSSTLRSYHSFT